MSAASPLRAVVLALAQKPEGVTNGEAMAATGKSAEFISGLFMRMKGYGELFTPSMACRSMRAFSSQAAADSYRKPKRARPSRAKPKVEKAAKPPKAVKPKKLAVKKAQPVTVRAARQELPASPLKASTEARITSQTKVTIAPPFVDRRWLPDVVRPVVDARECSAWARAVTERRARALCHATREA